MLMELVAEYGLFLAKTLTWLVAIVLVLGLVGGAVRQLRELRGERLEIRNVGQRLKDLAEQMNCELLPESEQKAAAKARRKEEKAKQKAAKHGEQQRPRVFVLHFEGDLQAHAVANLREEISAILQVAKDGDEVLLSLESAGGLVHAYGLGASQLLRLKNKNLKLTVAVDKVAASGGYLMACVADRILAAPFAVIGSIGVVAQLPNFNRLLKRKEIDVELHTAGEFKRTLTMFGENTDEARSKFRQELEDTHQLFKNFVSDQRPSVALEQVATGEHWYGTQALDLKLIDEISTSDDYLLSRVQDADVFELRQRLHRPIPERLGMAMARLTRAFSGRLRQSELP
ncbi:MAG: protease SohB [Panacagrimonas sp.]